MRCIKSIVLSLNISAITITSIVLGISFPSVGTPVGSHVRSVEELEQPRLYLVEFTVVLPQGIPGEGIVTNKFVDYTYRVYCPTAMVRNVTGGKWGNASLAWNDHSIGTGALTSVVYQVCPSHHDRINSSY